MLVKRQMEKSSERKKVEQSIYNSKVLLLKPNCVYVNPDILMSQFLIFQINESSSHPGSTFASFINYKIIFG